MSRKHALPEPCTAPLPKWRQEFGVHPDRIFYYIDAGLIEPAALVPKAALRFSIPGPARQVCIALPDYRAMDWQTISDDCAAPLVGEFRAFQVDGHQCSTWRFRAAMAW